MSKTKQSIPQTRTAGSIFSGGGLGDVGTEWGSGVPVLAACELLPSRAALIRKNFPQTHVFEGCLLYTSPSPRDRTRSRMPSSA